MLTAAKDQIPQTNVEFNSSSISKGDDLCQDKQIIETKVSFSWFILFLFSFFRTCALTSYPQQDNFTEQKNHLKLHSSVREDLA